MTSLLTQLKFNFKRMYLRNYGYQFFSLLMPIGFYILFTQIMVSGTAAQQLVFAKEYVGSMAIYSILINALMGFAQLVNKDRNSMLIQKLELSTLGTTGYYGSLAILTTCSNIFSVMLLQLTAIVENNVSISAETFIVVSIAASVSVLPIMIIGIVYSYIPNQELLSIIANITVFPLAMISGLWWPMSILPTWIRVIGESSPAYLAKKIIDLQMFNQKIPSRDIIGLVIWMIVGLGLSFIIVKMNRGGVRYAHNKSRIQKKNF